MGHEGRQGQKATRLCKGKGQVAARRRGRTLRRGGTGNRIIQSDK